MPALGRCVARRARKADQVSGNDRSAKLIKLKLLTLPPETSRSEVRVRRQKTDDEAVAVYTGADYRRAEGASGSPDGGRFMPQTRDQRRDVLHVEVAVIVVADRKVCAQRS